MRRSAFIASLGALSAAFFASSPFAQETSFPTRPVKLVVGQAPGGTTDILARAVASRLGELWKQNVIVENVAGASGNLGAQSVARAAPDGYTLLMTYEGSQAINPSVLPASGFHPVNDFTPIGTVARAGFLVVAGANSKVTSLADLIAAAKQQPDSVTYGSAGLGSANHLIAELLQDRSGTKLRHVPYRGAPQAITDLMAGQIDIAVASIPSAIGQVSGKTLRALAVTSGTRSVALPDVPTVGESGVPNYDVTPWWGILAPPAMNAALASRITADLKKILSEASVKEAFLNQGAEVFVQDPDDFRRLLISDIAKWSELVKKIKLN